MEQKKTSKTQHTQSPRVVRTSPQTPKRKRKKPQSKGVQITKSIFGAIGKVILTTLLVLTITGCIVGTALTIYVVQYINTAEPVKINEVALSFTTYIYGKDASGNDVEIGQLSDGGQKRTWVSLKDIPQYLKDAVVDVEDERFYEHDGVDYKRTLAALANEVLTKLHLMDGDRFGASTISQQLIKNIDQAFYDRDYDNKIKEILQAMTLERHYTKDQILESYLNIIGLGDGTNGVQAGAKHYFGKDVSELTLAECASLAVISKSPEGYDPLNNPEENKRRRDYALGKMLELGDITQAEYDEAIAQPVVAVKDNSTSQAGGGNAWSYFMDAVYEQVVDDLVEQYGYATREVAEKALKSSGWKVYTTQEIEIQEKLEAIFEDPETFQVGNLTEEEIPQAAMVILDPNTGNVVALVGGRGEKTDSLGFNRATMAQQRAFGSTIKPLSVYAPAFEQNLINWSTLVEDAPKKYKDPEDSLGRVTDYKEWPEGTVLPEDYDPKSDLNWPQNFNKKYDGWLTVIDAIKVSKNTTAVELCDLMGVQNSYNFLHDKLGFQNLPSAENLGLDSMALGSAGTTLMELTAAYQVFANGGYYTEPKLYTKVVDADGKVILDTTTRSKKQVLTSQTAYIMNRALWQVVNGGRTAAGSPSGTAASAVTQAGFETIGKTGTSMDRKDLLFAGCTPYYVAAIRYGHDDNSVIDDAITSDHIKVWAKVMNSVLEGYNPAKFELNSDGVVERQYCTKTGKLATEYCESKQTGYYKEVGGLPGECDVCPPAASEVILDPNASSVNDTATSQTVMD